MSRDEEKAGEVAKHPAGPRLEELASGGHDAETEAHVAACEACRAYVTKLREEVAAFAANDDGDAFLRAVEARAAREGTEETSAPEGAHGSGAENAADNAVDNVVRPLVWARLAWIAAPLVAAAMFLLLARPPVPPLEDRTAHDSLHFKGGTEVAAIVEREGHQERVTGEVRVRPGDRLRVEVGLDVEAPTVAGILEKSGTWTPLLPATLLEAGTHYSDEAARVDASGVDGWILVGRPDAVEHARQTRDFASVAVLPIVPVP